ncbi:MAG: sulfatase-like hydrolase/transferase [Myxococcales bacterium]|nr:sulfatase-like hydrolase/transferase [Myxococcales bacterium]TDJ02245.1 MAG: hypothetical protein E2O73_02710 [Deltaproteobacteria bacterium]TDJ05227.1 MAG: hypothetical protein E2O71_11875 [Deltaproteobacteria bacterium]
MDALAARGALFRNAISPSSWTLPAHMSLFTSLYPSYHKLDHGGRLGSVRLDESEVTLAEILKGAGYATAGFVAHPFLSGEWGFDLYRRFSTRADLQADRAQLWLEWHRFPRQPGARPSLLLPVRALLRPARKVQEQEVHERRASRRPWLSTRVL